MNEARKAGMNPRPGQDDRAEDRRADTTASTRNAKAISVKVWKFIVPALTPLKAGHEATDQPADQAQEQRLEHEDRKIGTGR
jgi:hypothetical protein